MSVEQQGALKRAMVVTASDRRRGAEVFGSLVASGLKARGWTADLVSMAGSGEPATIRSETLTNGLRSRLDTRAIRALRSRVSATSPSVVLAMGGSTLRYSVLATRGIPLVYFAIGEPKFWLRSGFSLVSNRYLLRRTTKILAVSKMTATQLGEIEPRIADRVSVVHTGVELPHVIDKAPNLSVMRVVMVGSLSKEKDPNLALRSFALVDGAVLRFVGSGSLEGEMTKAARDLGIESRVEFVGSVDDVSEHYKWADVLLLTSLTEGLPGVILEAASFQVPAVAVDVGGVSEAVDHSVTGLVVDRSAGSISSALLEFSGDPSKVRDFGRAARLKVEKQFEIGSALDRFDEALTEVVR